MIPAIALPPPSYEQTIEALATCGVKASNVVISYADELQSDVVVIRDLGGTEEARLGCVRRAVHPFYLIEVAATDQRSAYLAYDSRESSREFRAQALGRLNSKGMLSRVPHYNPGKELAEFARAVEAACSVTPETALEAAGPTFLTFRRSYLEHLVAAVDAGDGSFDCIMDMVAASDAEERGASFGLVGNEGDDPEKQR
jgi:hypothetical protein